MESLEEFISFVSAQQLEAIEKAVAYAPAQSTVCVHPSVWTTIEEGTNTSRIETQYHIIWDPEDCTFSGQTRQYGPVPEQV